MDPTKTQAFSLTAAMRLRLYKYIGDRPSGGPAIEAHELLFALETLEPIKNGASPEVEGPVVLQEEEVSS
jgi:hypothetical protein